MGKVEELTIVSFAPENQAEVKALILAGLAEHWGTLDPTKHPDLEAIATHYADAIFLVAWQDGRIVGTGALVPRGDGVAEVVRMSVAATVRRQGIGQRLLAELCARGRAAGYRRVVLETTATWHEVVAFYQRCGFKITHYQDGDVYFALELTDGK